MLPTLRMPAGSTVILCLMHVQIGGQHVVKFVLNTLSSDGHIFMLAGTRGSARLSECLQSV